MVLITWLLVTMNNNDYLLDLGVNYALYGCYIETRADKGEKESSLKRDRQTDTL